MSRTFDQYTAIGPFHPPPTYAEKDFDPDYQPEGSAPAASPFWGMAMYGGFVNTRYASWVPATQPGQPPPSETFGMGYYGGFVNEHKFPL